MKKVILFITLFSMISLFSYSKNPVKQWGQLQVKGNQLCDQTGDPIVLRGVSYGWHNLWPRFYNKQSVKWLKKIGNAPFYVQQWGQLLKTITLKIPNLH